MQFHEKKRRKVIINITSLIDVLFLLLIFFMVSSTFVEQPGMKLELPESKSSSTEKIKELILEIKKGANDFERAFQDYINTLRIKLITKEIELYLCKHPGL